MTVVEPHPHFSEDVVEGAVHFLGVLGAAATTVHALVAALPLSYARGCDAGNDQRRS